MSKKSGSIDIEVIKKDSSLNKNGGTGVEVFTKLLQQIPSDVWKGFGTALINQGMNHFDNEREGKKKIRESRIELLNIEYRDLLENIRKEEEKENFDQERINRWYERLDKNRLELKEMEDEANGFAKLMKKSLIQVVSSKSTKE